MRGVTFDDLLERGADFVTRYFLHPVSYLSFKGLVPGKVNIGQMPRHSCDRNLRAKHYASPKGASKHLQSHVGNACVVAEPRHTLRPMQSQVSVARSSATPRQFGFRIAVDAVNVDGAYVS
jgi:hypothetical protein